MKIYIVRHGETNLNKARVLQGAFDEPLNEEGIRLAKISGQNLKGIKFDEAFSSPLSRAYETTRIILEESGNKIEIKKDDRLKESNFGLWENTSITNDENHYAKDIREYIKNPFCGLLPPEGESVYQVINRTQDFLKELISRNDDKTYLIGMHGFALRAMLNMFYENKNDFWQGSVPPNVAFNIIEVHDGKAELVKKDVVYYDQKDIKQYYKKI